MAAELQQVLEDIKKAKDDIMAAEKSLNEVEEKLKTAKAIQAKKLNADQDYLRTLKISLLQLLSGLQQNKNRLVEAQDRSELDSSFRLVGSCHARFMAFNRLGIRTSHRLLDCACELLPFVRSDRRIRF